MCCLFHFHFIYFDYLNVLLSFVFIVLHCARVCVCVCVCVCARARPCVCVCVQIIELSVWSFTFTSAEMSNGRHTLIKIHRIDFITEGMLRDCTAAWKERREVKCRARCRAESELSQRYVNACMLSVLELHWIYMIVIRGHVASEAQSSRAVILRARGLFSEVEDRLIHKAYAWWVARPVSVWIWSCWWIRIVFLLLSLFPVHAYETVVTSVFCCCCLKSVSYTHLTLPTRRWV